MLTLPQLSEPLAITFNPETGRFEMMFDASAYKTSSCRKNVYYKIFKGITPGQIIDGIPVPKKDHKMEYGTAFHAALGYYYTYRRHGMTDAETQALQAVAVSKAIAHFMDPTIEVPEDDYRGINHLVGCLGQYFHQHALEPLEVLRLKIPHALVTEDIKSQIIDVGHPDYVELPLVEKKFCVPFYVDDVIEISLAGTIDLVAYNFDQLVILDHKTTSATSTTYYLKEYELSSQLMMYVFIFCRLFPQLLGGGTVDTIAAVVNGIFLRKTGKNDFQRSEPSKFTEQQMTAFERHLGATVVDIAANFRVWLNSNGTEGFDQNFTQCHTDFGCPFVNLCSADDFTRQGLIEQAYILNPYNPLSFQEHK